MNAVNGAPKVIRLVKDDKLTGRLQDEYYDAQENPHV